MRLLKEAGVDLVGLHAVVIGQSNIVGRPMALELLMARCTVTICHSATRDLPGSCGRPTSSSRCRKAEVRCARLDQTGAIVLDVGVNRLPDGKLCGDVDFEAVQDLASWITPVPGGVGPMTIATLLSNTLTAAKWQAGEKQ